MLSRAPPLLLAALFLTFSAPTSLGMRFECTPNTQEACDLGNAVLEITYDECRGAGEMLKDESPSDKLTPAVEDAAEACNEFRTEAEEASEEPRDAALDNATKAKERVEDTIAPPPAIEEEPSAIVPEPEATPDDEPMSEPVAAPIDSTTADVAPAEPVAAPEPSPESSVDDVHPAAPPAPEQPVSVSAANAPDVTGGNLLTAPNVAAAAAAATFSGLAYVIGAFFNRLCKSRVETNQMRSRIFDLVRTHPGTAPARIAQSLGLHPTTVMHHLRILTRFGHVVVHDEAGERWYFENHGRVPEGDRRTFAAIQRPQNLAFLHLVRRQGALRLADAARHLGLSTSTAGYRVTRLVQSGLLQRVPRGWQLTDRARHFLDRCTEPGGQTLTPGGASQAPATLLQGPSGIPTA